MAALRLDEFARQDVALSESAIRELHKIMVEGMEFGFVVTSAISALLLENRAYGSRSLAHSSTASISLGLQLLSKKGCSGL